VQKDSSAYYVLGFTSTNAMKDGKFRHLKVQLNRPDLKLDYRSGYYAGRDFEHLNRADASSRFKTNLPQSCRKQMSLSTQARLISGKTIHTIIFLFPW